MKADIKNEIDKIIQEAEDLEIPSEFNPKLLSIQEIIATDFGPLEWVIDKLIPRQSITVISGEPGSYKTWLTMEMAKSIV